MSFSMKNSNAFKKNPALSASGVRPTQQHSRHSHSSVRHESDCADFRISESEERERGYTVYPMYSSPEEVIDDRKSEIVFERSYSNVESNKSLFKQSVFKVMELQALVQKLKSFNSTLVKETLLQMIPLINSPETAVLLKDAGLCPLLFDLLKFDPLNHWKIVGLTLQVVLSVVSVPECAIAVVMLPNFYSTMESFLKSDRVITQTIAGRIVQHCFVQPIGEEWIVMKENNMLLLLFKAMELPYKDIQISLLKILEDLTYHCANTLRLCTFAESIDSDFITMILDAILSEESDIRLLGLKVYLNALCAIQLDKRIERAVIFHGLTVETSLLKRLQSLKRTKLGKASTLIARNSKITPLSEAGIERLSVLNKEHNIGPATRPSTRRKSFRHEPSSTEHAREESAPLAIVEDSGVTTLMVEEISVISEILWLIRSSVMFHRMVKHTKRSNLIDPSDCMSEYALTIL